jgi:glyoxylase-like metal-dependent hydrolase (beta-lactamase superfamily II)
MLSIGDIHIHVINDGYHHVDPGGAFGLVPRSLWSKYFTPDDDYRIPMTTINLLVQAGGKNIIIDTGFGEKRLTEKEASKFWRLERPTGSTFDALRRLGLTPADIDLVINTHLHADHCLGNMVVDADGQLKAAFPSAEYVVQRREYEDAMHPNERTRATYIAANFHPLVESGQMRLLDGDSDLAPGVRGVVTPGHTPGHMAVRFESQGQHGAFLCDMSTYAVHFERLGWMTAYDVEPLITLETKRVWQQWALDTNAMLIFPHDPYRTVGRLVKDDEGKLSVEKIHEVFA